MKTKILTFIWIINYSFGFAQSPIINIKDQDGTLLTGAYYKDSDNLLNPYEGTFIYTNGNISFKVVLEKKTQQYNGRYYEDLLIGEYEYKEGNVIVVSTLSDLSTVYNNQRRHSISGNSIRNKTGKPVCNECGTNELRVRLSFSDRERELYGSMTSRKIMHNNQEAIKVIIRCETNVVYFEGEPEPPRDFRVPDGEYILIKQP